MDRRVKQRKMRWFDRPACYILRFVSKGRYRKWITKLQKIYQNNKVEEMERSQEKAERFLVRQCAVIFWGMLFLIVLSCILIAQYYLPRDIIFERNSFGKGSKEVAILLEKNGKKKNYIFNLEEQELSPHEEDIVFREFFKKLEKKIKGGNTSLDKVNTALLFESEIEGFPFSISYEPEDGTYIQLDGSLGDGLTEELMRQRITTMIKVTATYQSYRKEKNYLIRFCPIQKEKEDSFQKVMRELSKREEETRNINQFSFSSQWNNFQISESNRGSILLLPILLFLIVVIIPVKNFFSLKEKEKKIQKEIVQDFSLIVHLLTLYMGAGLSFSSAVQRIASDYKKGLKKRNNRYAFDRIVSLSEMMRMGIRQKEACLNWGAQFSNTLYAKLAMLLVQSFSKGSKEAGYMMEQEEKEAFKARLDIARKEGEEASTKLVFPLIVLLIMIMFLIMVPAILQFQSF